MPEANAWLQQETLLRHEHVQLGLAVDTGYGLVVPVLHDADLLDLRHIQQELKVLSTKARAQQLNAGDSRGATLSRRGKTKKVRHLPLSLSFDHRALTGAEAIRFLQAVCYWLAAGSEKKGRP